MMCLTSRSHETEAVCLEDSDFYTCYRALIQSYCLSRDQTEAQLAEILRRVRARLAAPAPNKPGPETDRRIPP